jgi:hypothetical protein
MMKSAELAIWMPKNPWPAYRRDLRLWVLATGVPEERQVPYIIYRGIRPNHKVLADIFSLWVDVSSHFKVCLFVFVFLAQASVDSIVN